MRKFKDINGVEWTLDVNLATARTFRERMKEVETLKNVDFLDCAAVGCEDSRCGFAGSPTNVNKIMSVVLAGGAFKEVPATDEGIGGLVGELVADHTIG
jgi:electron transfer flavoprotein beta subunit